MKKKILITGGAGFIGTNSADYFLNKGYDVVILDNLSRVGTPENLKWLQKKWNKKLTFIKGDITNAQKKLSELAKEVDAILHLAGQVAVTLSVKDPMNDFKSNAEGTLRVLEAARNAKNQPLVIFASTNKVHGNMEDAEVTLTKRGYRHVEHPHGVSELHPLDFHSPYGCSKGAADQYVRDYARIYGLPTVVFRQSCIYGPHQFGMEDQGWVAWFAIRTLLNHPVTIYGDGHQVRDVLYVDDLCRLYELAIENRDKVSGHIYSIGGGKKNVSSILEAVGKIQERLDIHLKYDFADWRPGDQKVYISDIRKAKSHLGWEPKVSFEEGLDRLLGWAKDREPILRKYIKP